MKSNVYFMNGKEYDSSAQERTRMLRIYLHNQIHDLIYGGNDPASNSQMTRPYIHQKKDDENAL